MTINERLNNAVDAIDEAGYVIVDRSRIITWISNRSRFVGPGHLAEDIAAAARGGAIKRKRTSRDS